MHSSCLSISNDDYIILYAPSGQTGETVLTFNSRPSVDTKTAPGVQSSVSGNTVTLTYTLGSPAFTRISFGFKTVVVGTMAKETALNWHAVDLPNGGSFGNYFSLGTNSRYVLFQSVRRLLMSTNCFQRSRRWSVPRPLCLAGWQYYIVPCKLYVVFDPSKSDAVQIERRLER